MELCKDCLKKCNAKKCKETTFPIWTLFGGAMGVLVAIAAGPLAIVAGLLTGVAGDVVRCSGCGKDVKDAYRLMLEKRGEWGEKVYRPVSSIMNRGKKPSPSFRFNETEGQFEVIQDMDTDNSMDALELDMLLDQAGLDISYDADPSMDIGFDSDFDGDFTDFGTGDFGTGDGGDLGAGSGGEGGGSE
jgi:hypothetical protein